MKSKRKDKILIVDDDPLNLLILEEVLGKEYDLYKASTAEEAIEAAGKFHPDLILLDIMMPGANGYEVCRQLRSNKYLQLTKIILVSSKALLKDRLDGYKAGADDYISKPFDTDELLAKVRIFIRLKSVEEIDRAKDDLINLFSHETRTPMHSVIGFAKFLLDSPNLAPEEKESVKMIIESGANLLDLINKTILLGSLRKENRELSVSQITPDHLCKTAIEKKRSDLDMKNISVNTDFEVNEPMSVDVELIETSLTYLLDNAIKHSPEGGDVLFKSAKNQQNGITLLLRDHGSGIPKDRLDNLFDEFGVDDIAHHGRGHGLSLAIIKYIMEMHGGEVEAENNQDEPGSTFFLRFSDDVLKIPSAKSE